MAITHFKVTCAIMTGGGKNLPCASMHFGRAAPAPRAAALCRPNNELLPTVAWSFARGTIPPIVVHLKITHLSKKQPIL